MQADGTSHVNYRYPYMDKWFDDNDYYEVDGVFYKKRSDQILLFQDGEDSTELKRT